MNYSELDSSTGSNPTPATASPTASDEGPTTTLSPELEYYVNVSKNFSASSSDVDAYSPIPGTNLSFADLNTGDLLKDNW